jgi:hypothetical protein
VRIYRCSHAVGDSYGRCIRSRKVLHHTPMNTDTDCRSEGKRCSNANRVLCNNPRLWGFRGSDAGLPRSRPCLEPMGPVAAGLVGIASDRQENKFY